MAYQHSGWRAMTGNDRSFGRGDRTLSGVIEECRFIGTYMDGL